jgi:ATP-dependent Zn protease
MFENIAGYANIKKELGELAELYLNPRNLESPTVKLPRGILLYGTPGNGKTLFAREFIAALGAPVFVIKAEDQNLRGAIQRAFDAAKKAPFAIVLAEEIDLLFQKDDKSYLRIFQEEMDGYENESRFIVLATTNHISDLPDPLLRAGRFDRQIHLDYPTGENLNRIFDYYLKKMGVKNLDCSYLDQIACGVSCADVQAIVNDAYAKKGASLSFSDIDEAYRHLVNRAFEPYYPDETLTRSLSVAIHEAGHAILVERFASDFVFYRASYGVSSLEGTTRFFARKDRPDSSERLFENAVISLGGYAANRILEGYTPEGAERDLDDARHILCHLVNRTGFCGAWRVLPEVDKGRPETERTRYKNEFFSHLLFRKALHQASRYIRHHKNQVRALAERLQKQGFLAGSDMAELLNRPTNARALGGKSILATASIKGDKR